MNAPQRLLKLRKLCVGELAEALKNDLSDVVRHEAAFLIGESFGKNPTQFGLEALVGAITDMSIIVRHEVALALAKSPGEISISALVRLCADSSQEVRDSAEFALVEMLMLK